MDWRSWLDGSATPLGEWLLHTQAAACTGLQRMTASAHINHLQLAHSTLLEQPTGQLNDVGLTSSGCAIAC
jgi:hypothetical protein